jgi:hypothetical protein
LKSNINLEERKAVLHRLASQEAVATEPFVSRQRGSV